MKQITVSEQEAGQRLDKLLHKIMKEAPGSFLYKMLRKKNITLNAKKADGSEKVVCGDQVTFFFSDETFDKFAPGMRQRTTENNGKEDGKVNGAKGGPAEEPDNAVWREAEAYQNACRKIGKLEILYEDEQVLLVNKPAGLLSQKASAEDLSLNEWLIGHLLLTGRIEAGTLRTFKPSVCNRLDRNTSGLVICGVSLAGSRRMGELLKERSLHKYYRLLVKGCPKQETQLDGWLLKDTARNQVKVLTGQELKKLSDREQALYSNIRTNYRRLATNGRISLLEAQLITGKTHQIRAHLASTGYPLLGDTKYGDKALNQSYRQSHGIKHQMLHAYRVVFPTLEAPFAALSGREFICSMPAVYETILREG